MKKLILNIICWTLTLLAGLINAPLYSMRSRVYTMPRYSIHQRESCMCMHHIRHTLCCPSVCRPLMNAIIMGDIETAKNHITPSNVDATVESDKNWLTFAIASQKNAVFIVALIRVLIENGFSGDIVEPILLSNDRTLAKAFIIAPDLAALECNTLPMRLYQLYQERKLTCSFAADIAFFYSCNTRLPQTMRTRCELIEQIIKHGSIKSVMEAGNTSIICDILVHYPELITEHQFYIPHPVFPDQQRPVTTAEYAAYLFRKGTISKAIMFSITKKYCMQYSQSVPMLPASLPNSVDEFMCESDDATVQSLVGGIPRLCLAPPPDTAMPPEPIAQDPSLLTTRTAIPHSGKYRS